MSFGLLLLIIVFAYILGLLTTPLLLYIRLTITGKAHQMMREESRST